MSTKASGTMNQSVVKVFPFSQFFRNSTRMLRMRNASFVAMMIPAVLIIILMMVFPVLFTAHISLHDWSAATVKSPQWVAFANYEQLLFGDARFHSAFLRTIYLTAIATGMETILGTALALLFHREFVGRGFWRTLLLLPMVTTPVAMSLIWLLILDPSAGVVNWGLGVLGLPPGTWLNKTATVLPSLAMIDIWQWSPLIMIMVLAGLSMLPTEPFEAAAIDGASPWQTFWKITLPMLRPYIVIAVLFRLIDSLKTFDIIFATTQGGPGTASETLNLYAYTTAFTYFRLGYASAILVLFFALILAASLVLIRLRREPW
jgi:multiple sugar transport system permease protein